MLDGMLVLHDLDQKQTQVFDLKLAEYDESILIPNLQTNHQYLSTKFLSDLFLAEEIPKESQEDLAQSLVQTIQAKIQALKEERTESEEAVEQKEEENQKFSIYEDECLFIAPNILITPAPIRVLTIKFSLEKFVSQHSNLGTFMISLINRENNKAVLMQLVQELMLQKQYDLSKISKFFKTANRIYKQAGQERTQIKRRMEEEERDSHYNNLAIFDRQNLTSDQFEAIEKLIIKLKRIGRLRANTTFNATCLNYYLSENAPSARVLTGECIVFQNETLELFKSLINASQAPLDRRMGGPLKVRYVSSIILEFIRSIYEEAIPLQP